MAGKAIYWADKILGLLLRSATFVKPTNVYLALYSGDPLAGGVEIASTGGYARVAIPTGDTYWTAITTSGGTRITTNVNAANFGTATAAWNGGIAITHIALLDAVTAGNMFYAAVLGASRIVANGDPVSVAAGAITVFEPGA